MIIISDLFLDTNEYIFIFLGGGGGVRIGVKMQLISLLIY